MSDSMIDANVLIDVLTRDPTWFGWSAEALERAADAGPLVLNPIIYSEVSLGFDRIEDLDAALPATFFRREPLPWEAGFLAGRCFLQYRRAGGSRRSPLPDFYIGAHASLAGLTLVTRDAATYRSYFPRLQIVAPR